MSDVLVTVRLRIALGDGWRRGKRTGDIVRSCLLCLLSVCASGGVRHREAFGGTI